MSDERRVFMGMAETYAQMSADPSTKVGAVITQKMIPVAFGYNHIAQGIAYSALNIHEREWKYPRTIHAEQDAILRMLRHGVTCDNPRDWITLYTTHFPCAACAALIIEVGIAHVWTYSVDPEMAARWPSMETAENMFKEAGVSVTYLDK